MPTDDSTPAAPLTRREARALEQRGRERSGTQRSGTDTSGTDTSGTERRARGASARGTSTRRKSASPVTAATLSRPTVRTRQTASSMLLSSAALLASGALLVVTSVPSNAFITDAVADPAPVVAADRAAGQSLQVAASSESGTTARDNFEVMSHAQVLALKYSGMDYSYTTTSGAVRWPFPYVVPITDGFGPRGSGFHKGVDFVPGAGSPIYAIADGVAVSAGYDDSGYGNHVVIQHTLGGVNVKSNYAHMMMDSSPIVAGQQIKVGDFLGLVGDTGVAYGAHLHFEIYIDNVPIDPFAWLQANASN